MNNDKIKLKAWYNVTQNIMVIYIYTIMLSHGTQIFSELNTRWAENCRQSNLTFMPTLGPGCKLALWWGGIIVGGGILGGQPWGWLLTHGF